MSSFFSRMRIDLSNALSDTYSNFMYGDDTGKCAKLVYIAKPSNHDDYGRRVDLHMEFIEISDRAYVHFVEQDSIPDKIGIHVKDALQFATILSPMNELIPSSSILKSEECAKEWALEMERRGQRSSFKELNEIIKAAGDGNRTFPILLVFRRTRKRVGNNFSGGGPPMGLPSFRMDEECDRAASLIRKLAPSDDQIVEEVTGWDELYHDTKEMIFGDGIDSSKKKTIEKMNSSEYDEQWTDDFSISKDSFEKESDERAKALRDKNISGNRRSTDDIEASTIRDMVSLLSSIYCFTKVCFLILF